MKAVVAFSPRTTSGLLVAQGTSRWCLRRLRYAEPAFMYRSRWHSTAPEDLMSSKDAHASPFFQGQYKPQQRNRPQPNGPEKQHGKVPPPRTQNHHGEAKPSRAPATPKKASTQRGKAHSQAQRGRHDPAVDAQSLSRDIKVPTEDDYPGSDLSQYKNARQFAARYQSTAFKITTRMERTSSGVHRAVTQCQIAPDGKSKSIKAVGEARSPKAAEEASFHVALSKLHEAGYLERIIDANSLPVEKIDEATIRDEVDAKVDVYNYAARFDGVPQFQSEAKINPFRKEGNVMVEVRIAFPLQGLRVRALSKSLQTAEIAACLKFKAEAEKRHAESGEDTLIIKDATTLNTANAKNFFEWFGIENRNLPVHVQTETTKSSGKGGMQQLRAQLLLGGEPTGEPVEMLTKKKAELVAYLAAAVEVKAREPGAMERFAKALKAGGGDILRPVPPIDLQLEPESAMIMRETLYAARAAGLQDRHQEIESDAPNEDVRRMRHWLRYRDLSGLDEKLIGNLEKYRADQSLVELRQKRADLPMNQFQKEALDMIQNNMFSIVIGATGSGKTTQVPQILLENEVEHNRGSKCNIVCTQPRRIAATSVAKRVAFERNEPLQETVGYQVRFDTKLPRLGGSITYCTTGILLQQLQHSPNEILDHATHILIDEVHERSTEVDFLLIVLKTVLQERLSAHKRVPKVVLMSATMDGELFANYFQTTAPDGMEIRCPSLNVPGRTFPVAEKYLQEIMGTVRTSFPQLNNFIDRHPATKEYLEVEQRFASSRPKAATSVQDEPVTDAGETLIDWKQERTMRADGTDEVSNEREESLVPVNLAAATIAHIVKTTADGAILVFLPGWDEISSLDSTLRDSPFLGVKFDDPQKFRMFLLHSSVTDKAVDVFEPVPEGCRKIIIATNIAETSITIPDVQHVVDAGKLREKRYDQLKRITSLQCTWVSKSNAKQRAGRAGRVQNGNFWALYSKQRHDSLRAVGLPEILRSDLQEVCLNIRAQKFDLPIRDFLGAAIEKPSPQAVDAAIDSLQSLEALTEDEDLTPLGRLLASLPVDPSLGKMIVLGIVFRCLDPMLILGAASAQRSIFTSPPDKKKEALRARKELAGETESDHLAVLFAYHYLRDVQSQHRSFGGQRDAAHRMYLHFNTYRVIDQTVAQIADILVEAGLIPNRPRSAGYPELNRNSDNINMVRGLLLSGLYPNVAAGITPRLFRTISERGVTIHPSSVNAPPRNPRQEAYTPSHRGKVHVYGSLAQSNDGHSLFMRDTTPVNPLTAAMFGGRLRLRGSYSTQVSIDDWLTFSVRGDPRNAKTIIEFRKGMGRLLTNTFMDLSKRGRDTSESLADDPAREIFAQGLAQLLSEDYAADVISSQRNWRRH